jgi:uncharacterized membrane protein YdcZ (DUF606 family)
MNCVGEETHYTVLIGGQVVMGKILDIQKLGDLPVQGKIIKVDDYYDIK